MEGVAKARRDPRTATALPAILPLSIGVPTMALSRMAQKSCLMRASGVAVALREAIITARPCHVSNHIRLARALSRRLRERALVSVGVWDIVRIGKMRPLEPTQRPDRNAAGPGVGAGE